MKCKILVLICAIFSSEALPSQRIVGGEDATSGQFPYIASLRMSNGTYHICGGTIISKRTILTAAHCKVSAIDDTFAVVGTITINGDEERIPIEEFLIHPDYKPSILLNDIGLVILSKDIELINGKVEISNLPVAPTSFGSKLVTAGWGYTSLPNTIPTNLQWFETTTITLRECSDYVSGVEFGRICTFSKHGQGICVGDSGGPLVNQGNNGTVVGVTSATLGCAEGKPDLFTDVFYYKEWIFENMK